MKAYKDPLDGPVGAVAKFIGAALFGCFISIVVAAIVLWSKIDTFWKSPFLHVFWNIPVVWGILGIFWFDFMLDAARKIVEGFIGVESD